MPHISRDDVTTLVRRIQDQICAGAAQIDGKSFHEDTWEREGGGGGITRVLQGGNLFEKAGVNVSAVHGVLPVEAIEAMAGGALSAEDFVTPKERTFFATGVSVVMHPHHPMAPTAHCNYRYFEVGGESGSPKTWWFGGGADLTPSYLFEEDAVHFHRVHKAVCDTYDTEFYPRFKVWCDEYFEIKHRGECRGVGGIFFDYLNDREPAVLMDFARDCGAAFVDAYMPLVSRRSEGDYTDAQKRWQGLRRGRYVEFNLIYDRGTTFGLKTGGRVESILMSLPVTARWEYDVQPEPNSPEAQLTEVLRTPRDWV